MNQREQATIDLVINGQQAETNVGAVGRAVIGLTRELRNMNEAEDPARYQQLIERRNQLNQTYTEMNLRINGARRSLQELDSQTEESGGRMSAFWDRVKSISLGNLISQGVTAALGAIKEVIAGSEEAFEEAEQTQTALQNKLRQTGGVAGESNESLLALQETLMNQTGVDDDVIAKGEEMLLSFTNVRGVIFDQAMPAIVNYTAAMNKGKVTMEGIQGAAELLGKGLDDLTKVKKTARAMDINLTEAELKQIDAHRRNNDIIGGQQILIDALNKRYGDLAANLSQTETGTMQRFETRLGNIQEVIGQWIVKGKTLWVEVLSPFMEWMEKVTGSRVSDKLREEQQEMDGLVRAIISTNQNQTIRNELIRQLQEKYPDFIGNISKEAATNELLTRRITEANDQYRIRIFMASNEERLTDLQAKRNKLIKEEAEARERVAKQSGLSLEQLAKQTDDQVKRMAIANVNKQQEDSKNNPWQFHSNYDQAVKDRNTILAGTTKIQDSFKEEADIMSANAVQQQKLTDMTIKNLDIEIAKMKEKMAVEKDAAKKKEDQAEIDRLQKAKNQALGIVEKPTGGPTGKEQNAMSKQIEGYGKQLDEVRSQYLELAAAAQKGTIDDLDAQLKVIDNKYNKIVDKLLALSKDPHVKDLVKQELLSDIDNINKKGGLRDTAKKTVTTDFSQKQDQKNIKADNESKKQITDEQGALEGRVNSFFDTQKGTLDTAQSTAETTAKNEQARQNIQEDFATRGLELEKQRYQALLDVRKTFAKDAGDIEKKLGKTELDIANDTSKKKAKVQAEDFALAKTLTNGLADMVELTMGNSSAGIAMQKLVAATQIGIDTAQAISAATKTGAYVGFTPIEKAIAIAGNIAVVLANMVKAKSLLSGAQDVKPTPVKKYAEGGNTGMATSNDPAGFVNVPTLFSSKYIAGEAGGEWIAPNWMLKNPYTANVVGAMEALRQRGPGAVTSTAPAGANGTRPTDQPTGGVSNSDLLNVLTAIHGAIQDQEVYINYQNFNRDMARIAKLKTSAGNKG